MSPRFQKRQVWEGKPARLGLTARFLDRMLRALRRSQKATPSVSSGGLRSLPLRKWILILFLAGFLLVGGYLLFVLLTLPNIDDPYSLIASESSAIVDREGVELYRLHGEEDRTFIPLEAIPESMRASMISIEDERYYDRGCMDFRALLRAVVFLGRAGGGSTITRQLARNALDLKRENVYQRKLKELVLGCQLESKFSKDELLELYLNWIPFGQNAYGVEQATQVYFGKSASGLTLSESVVLASLPQRPTYFSPYGRHRYTQIHDDTLQGILAGEITIPSQVPPEHIRIGLLGANIGTGSTVVYIGGRTDQVLQNMQNQGYIDESERVAALKDLQSIEFRPSRESIRAPHFVLWVRDQVEDLFAGTTEEGLLEQGGLTIETTLDWDMQQAADEVFAFHREDLLERYGAQNLALLSVDTKTREILAYIGNADFSDTEHSGQVDMVQAPRQPGSSFKPFVYATALTKGYTPGTVLYDVPTVIGEDEPQNFDNKFMGPLTMRYALAASRNVPAAKAFFLAGGEDPILALVSNMGAPSPHRRREELNATRPEGYDYGWPLALGAAETPLYEMVEAYSTFADGGNHRPLIAIKRIVDRNGNLLYQAESESREVMDERVAYQITAMLSDPVARPEPYWRTQLSVGPYESAAKTGTSNKCLERNEETGACELLRPDNAWLIGYTPNLVTGVWAGNADGTSLFPKAGGLNTASPLWHDFMLRAHRTIENPVQKFPVPDRITRPQISLLSGQLPTECTPVTHRRSEVFRIENAPKGSDSRCQQLQIDRITKLLASDECPESARMSGSFLVAQSILPKRWPLWEEGVQEWVTEQMDLWWATETHSGATIPVPIAPREQCRMTPERAQKPAISLLSPKENGTASYPSFKPRIQYTVGSEVLEVIYRVDGKRSFRQTVEPFNRPLRMPRSIDESGWHTLEVTIRDIYFNEAKDSVRFSFGDSKSEPTLSILFPPSGKKSYFDAGSRITFQVDADVEGSAIRNVTFYLNGEELNRDATDPFEFTHTLDLEPGTHTFRAVAQDIRRKKISAERGFIVVEGDSDVSTGDPRILQPTYPFQPLRIGDIVDIRIDTPKIGTDEVPNLILVVEGNAGQSQDILLKLPNGDGVYSRPWKAKRPGEYTILLSSDPRDGDQIIWDKREGMVVR